MTDKLPEYVYLIETPHEWPVDAVAGDHPSAPEWIADKITQRRKSGNVGRSGTVRVWRAKLTDIEEMVLEPGQIIKPTLVPRGKAKPRDPSWAHSADELGDEWR